MGDVIGVVMDQVNFAKNFPVDLETCVEKAPVDGDVTGVARPRANFVRNAPVDQEKFSISSVERVGKSSKAEVTRSERRWGGRE